jgi:hypothetical protein
VSRTIVFIYGAWVTPACWERMLPWVRGEGVLDHRQDGLEEVAEHAAGWLAGHGLDPEAEAPSSAT